MEIGNDIAKLAVRDFTDVPGATHRFPNLAGMGNDGIVLHVPRDIDKQGASGSPAQVGGVATGEVLPVRASPGCQLPPANRPGSSASVRAVKVTLARGSLARRTGLLASRPP